jgi:hypothetical protein
VWNDDDLKVRDLLPSIKEHKPVIQFMELYKYRYESYPDMRYLQVTYFEENKFPTKKCSI